MGNGFGSSSFPSPAGTSTWNSLFKENNLTSSKDLNIKLYPQGIHIDNLDFSLKTPNKTQGIPTDVNFTVNDNILSFSLNYKGDNINAEIYLDGGAKQGDESVNLNISVDRSDSKVKVSCIIINLHPVIFTFLMEDLTNLNSLKWIEVRDLLQNNLPTTCNVINENLDRVFKTQTENINLKVELFCRTDNYFLNLGELGGNVIANKSYPNGYPKELVGKCDNSQKVTNLGIQTLYSFKPKLSKVLKGEGNTLFVQTNSINSMYDTGLTDCEFFLNILAYCSFRYMLGGLSNDGDFSCKWLYANNYKKFLKSLKRSEFSAAAVIFTEPQECFDFTDFNKYFKSCDHK